MASIRTNQIHLNVGAFQLHELTLSIPAGKMTAIVGPNGSGKSTLLKIISRLIHADKGEVYVHEKRTNGYSSIDFAKTLSMLTQAKSAIPDLTVRELVAYGRSPYKRLFDRMNAEDQDIIEWAMGVTGTARHANRMFHTLSGGEQQKARIAMALAQKTEIILLDEPTTFLDIAHQLDVMEMLQSIHEQYRITIVMVLHDLQQAASYCHYLIALKRGRVVKAGEPRQLISPHFLKDVYNIEAKVRYEENYPIIIPIRQAAARDASR